MGVLLQPECSLAVNRKYELATDHFGTFSGLDSILSRSVGAQRSVVKTYSTHPVRNGFLLYSTKNLDDVTEDDKPCKIQLVSLVLLHVKI